MSAKSTYRFSRLTIVVCCTLLLTLNVAAQFNSGTLGGGTDGTYSSFPMSNQLYPRVIATNLATITFSANIITTKSNVRIRVFRDDNQDGDYDDSGEEKNPVIIGNSPISFTTTVTIPAELFSYRFQLAYNSNEFWLERSNIVAGDAFYIAGQSNAEAKPVVSADNNQANFEADASRNFVRVYGGGSSSMPQWSIGNGNNNYNQEFNTGQFGMRIGSRIVAERGIPVCIMNGAELGFPIDYFLRNDLNIYDPLTNYGRELTRLNNAGLKNSIRAVIWFQGESNTHSGSNGQILTTAQYMAKFNLLYNDWDVDLGLANKFYMIQIKPGCFTGSTPERAAEIQEAERLLDESNPLMEIVSTNNIQQHTDNCHYRYQAGQRLGYREIGDRVFTLISRDFYGVTPPANSLTPVPVSAEFTSLLSTGIANEVTVHFNNPSDDLAIVNGDISGLLKLQGGSYTINSANVVNTGIFPTVDNVLKIGFSPVGSQPNPSGLAFLSPSNGSVTPPQLTAGGLEGIGMINFNNLPLGIGILPVDPLNLRISANTGANNLHWEADNNPQFNYFIVERGDNGSTFTEIAKVTANSANGLGNYEFTDSKPNTVRNYYRIKAFKKDGKSLYSQVVAVNNRTSSAIGITVYPNPVTDRANVGVKVKKAGAATIQIYDGAGKMVSTRKINLQKGNNMFSAGEILDQSAGIYTIRVVTEEEVFNARIMRVK